MQPSQLDLQNIVKVLELNSYEKTNRHIEKGWVLLGLYSVHYSEHGYAPLYNVGWPKQKGEIQYPEKTEAELETERAFANDDGLPF